MSVSVIDEGGERTIVADFILGAVVKPGGETLRVVRPVITAHGAGDPRPYRVFVYEQVLSADKEALIPRSVLQVEIQSMRPDGGAWWCVTDPDGGEWRLGPAGGGACVCHFPALAGLPERIPALL